MDNQESMNQADANGDSTVSQFLSRAAYADEHGDAAIALHLYLAAFEKSLHSGQKPSNEAIEGLKAAWVLACRQKERSLAEYVFDKLQPYLNNQELAHCAEELQGLMIDKLESFGISREDLEHISKTISQDIEKAFSEHPNSTVIGTAIVRPNVSHAAHAELSSSDASDKAEIALLPDARLTFDNLPGFKSVIQTMREFGIGEANNPDYVALVEQLNARHGFEGMPAADTLLFRAEAREDALEMALATVGELNLPSVRMSVQEGFQGFPVLCVSALPNAASVVDMKHGEFTGQAVLVLEDVDLWMSPNMGEPEEFAGFLMAQLSRGAREALNLIKSAVDNADVYVLATASANNEIDAFFLDLLEPVSVIEIDLPTVEDRIEIWMDIVRTHPSLRMLDLSDLVKYSANLPRCDIYTATREALEEAYKEGLARRAYVPVRSQDLFEKLASFQPLDSAEYQSMEERILADFSRELTHVDDLLRG